MSDDTFDPLQREVCCLHHLLGPFGAHVVLIGGMAPGLLVPDREHRGTTDIDLCLSVALCDGDTNLFDPDLTARLEPWFTQDPKRFYRWRKKPGAPGIPVVVDFLAPPSPEPVGPELARAPEDPTATRNFGTMEPVVLETGDLVDADRDAWPYACQGLYSGDSVQGVLQVVGPIGLLASKARALTRRATHKDGYDVAWWALNSAGTVAQAYALLSERATFTHSMFRPALDELANHFDTPSALGPRGYATIMAPGAPETDEWQLLANTAYARVSRVIDLCVEALDGP